MSDTGSTANWHWNWRRRWGINPEKHKNATDDPSRFLMFIKEGRGSQDQTEQKSDKETSCADSDKFGRISYIFGPVYLLNHRLFYNFDHRRFHDPFNDFLYGLYYRLFDDLFDSFSGFDHHGWSPAI